MREREPERPRADGAACKPGAAVPRRRAARQARPHRGGSGAPGTIRE